MKNNLIHFEYNNILNPFGFVAVIFATVLICIQILSYGMKNFEVIFSYITSYCFMCLLKRAF